MKGWFHSKVSLLSSKIIPALLAMTVAYGLLLPMILLSSSRANSEFRACLARVFLPQTLQGIASGSRQQPPVLTTTRE